MPTPPPSGLAGSKWKLLWENHSKRCAALRLFNSLAQPPDQPPTTPPPKKRPMTLAWSTGSSRCQKSFWALGKYLRAQVYLAAFDNQLKAASQSTAPTPFDILQCEEARGTIRRKREREETEIYDASRDTKQLPPLNTNTIAT